MATRSLVCNAVVIALSGMHPFLHPALRSPWNLRMRTARVAQHCLTDSEARVALVSTAYATKEAVRRLLASTVQAAPAMQMAFAQVGHPVGLMIAPPIGMPARGMEAAMAAFVDSGLALCSTSNDLSYHLAINSYFSSQTNNADETDQADQANQPSIEWDAPWLGQHLTICDAVCALVFSLSDLLRLCRR